MKSECLATSVRAIKTIRFLMYMSEAVLKKDPTIRFILYVRDPRGTILSRWGIETHLRKKNVYAQRQHALELCTRMQHDFDVYQQLSVKYPGHFLLVRYEDLALYPHETSKFIYNSLGRTVPLSVDKWINGHTHSTKKVKAVLGTNRNSSAVAERWRTDMTQKEQTIITSQCKRLLRTLGYPLT